MFDLKTANHNSLFSQFDHIVTGCDSRIKQVGDDDDDDDDSDDGDEDTHGRDSGEAVTRDLHACSFPF